MSVRTVLARAARRLAWTLTLFGFWLLLVGTNSGLEEVCGAIASVIGGIAAASVRASGLLRAAPDPPMLVRTLRVPRQVVVEFWWLLAALAVGLARRRRPHGGYVATPFDAGGDDPRSRGRRAIAGIADTISPNVVFVDADCERDLALRHALDLDHVPGEIP